MFLSGVQFITPTSPLLHHLRSTSPAPVGHIPRAATVVTA